MKHLLLCFAIPLLTGLSFGQDLSSDEDVRKCFLIISSTADYSEAFKTAEIFAIELELKLDLRDLVEYQDNNGLTLSKADCKEGRRDYPCYIERGNRDNGDYVSIEWSNAYKEFTKGHYIVIVSGQKENNTELKTLLKRVQKIIPTAYIKSAIVFEGCSL